MANIRPDHVIHLGDHFEDGQILALENPHVRFHQVPGNCDRYAMLPGSPDILCYPIGGVLFYMTHGHKHGVKSGTQRLVLSAKEKAAGVVLYGHTHVPDCRQEADGMWVLNPGSCEGEGTVGFITVEDERISSCRIMRQEEV